MKILYFTYIENPMAPENAGVMRGQVLNILSQNAIMHTKEEFHWLAIINTNIYSPSEEEMQSFKEELLNNNVHLHLYKLPKERKKWAKFAFETFLSIVDNLKPDIVHCRVYPASYLAVKLKKKFDCKFKVIFDARGVYPEQILERSSKIVGKIRFYWWKYLEKFILKNADLTIGVTEVFVDHFKNIVNKANIKYIPCAAKQPDKIDEEQIKKLKQEIGYTDEDIIAVYSGNLSAKYSSVDNLVTIFSNLYRMNNNFKLLVLSKSSPDKLKELLIKENLQDKLKVFSLTPQEVYQYLFLADIGLLFREESLVNKVAMPTKFAEYMFSGIPVIISTSILGVARIVEKQNLGIVLSKIKISEKQLEHLMSISSENCKKAARQFSVEKVSEMYYEEYKKLLT